MELLTDQHEEVAVAVPRIFILLKSGSRAQYWLQLYHSRECRAKLEEGEFLLQTATVTGGLCGVFENHRPSFEA